MTSDARIYQERRRTLYFIDEIRAIALVFLDTPKANSTVRGRSRPRVARYAAVNGDGAEASDVLTAIKDHIESRCGESSFASSAAPGRSAHE